MIVVATDASANANASTNHFATACCCRLQFSCYLLLLLLLFATMTMTTTFHYLEAVRFLFPACFFCRCCSAALSTLPHLLLPHLNAVTHCPHLRLQNAYLATNLCSFATVWCSLLPAFLLFSPCFLRVYVVSILFLKFPLCYFSLLHVIFLMLTLQFLFSPLAPVHFSLYTPSSLMSFRVRWKIACRTEAELWKTYKKNREWNDLNRKHTSGVALQFSFNATKFLEG